MIKKYALLFFLSVVVGLTHTAYGQTLKIDFQGLNISEPCFNDLNDTRDIRLKIENYALLINSQYIFEISNDNFITVQTLEATPIGTPTPVVPGSTTFFVDHNIKFPKTLWGPNYRIKARTTSPAAEKITERFPAYYQLFNKEFSINDKVQSVTICSNSKHTIKIDDKGDDTSPLFYPELKYKWYRGSNITTGVIIPGETGPSLTVNQTGSYYAKVDYGNDPNNPPIDSNNDGACTRSTDAVSNVVTIIVSAETASASISNNSSNDLCDGNPRTLTASLPNSSPYTFQWFKDGKEIANATNNQYTVTEKGIYSLNIYNGTCYFDANNEITIEGGEEDIQATFEPAGTERDGIIYIAPPASFPLRVRLEITKAVDPEVNWVYDQNTPVDDRKSGLVYTYDVKRSETKEFTITIKEKGSACVGKIIKFIVGDATPPTTPFGEKVPNIVTPNGDGINDKWNITEEYTNKDFVKVQIIDPRGKLLVDTTNYNNDWPAEGFEIFNSDSVYYYIIYEDNTPVKQGSITVLK
jgi:gliding motility-associated-like protein